MKTETRFLNLIMEYWRECAYRDMKSDYEINKLVYNYALSCGIKEEDFDNDVCLTVKSMTNTQRKKLYKLMIKSKIKYKTT